MKMQSGVIYHQICRPSNILQYLLSPNFILHFYWLLLQLFLDVWNRFVSRLIDNKVLFTMDTIKESHILLYYSFDFGEWNMWKIVVNRIKDKRFPTFYISFRATWKVKRSIFTRNSWVFAFLFYTILFISSFIF